MRHRGVPPPQQRGELCPGSGATTPVASSSTLPVGTCSEYTRFVGIGTFGTLVLIALSLALLSFTLALYVLSTVYSFLKAINVPNYLR